MNAKIVKTQIVKHLPQILSIISCVGVPAVAYFSGKNTLKAHYILEKKREEKAKALDECVADLTFGEKVKAVWKYYIPTAAAMGLTIGSMIASQRISAAQLASMTAACSYMALSRKEALQPPEANEGKECENKVQTAAAETMYKNWAEPTGFGNELCLDMYSGRFFLSSKDDVMDGLRNFKEMCTEKDSNGNTDTYLAYNDLYGCLGLEPSYFGDEYGWHITNDDDSCGTDPDAIDFFCDYNEIKGQTVLTIGLASDAFPYDGWLEY